MISEMLKHPKVCGISMLMLKHLDLRGVEFMTKVLSMSLFYTDNNLSEIHIPPDVLSSKSCSGKQSQQQPLVSFLLQATRSKT